MILLKEDVEVIRFIIASEKINKKLKSQNHDLINEFSIPGTEDIFVKLLGSLSSGGLDALKEYMIDAIFDYLGFTSDNILGMFLIEFIKEFLENIVLENPTRILKYFDEEEGCKHMSKDMIEVMGKAGSDMFIAVFVDYITSEKFQEGLQNDLDSGSMFSAAIGSITSNVVDALSDSVTLEGLSKTLKETFQNEILIELEPHLTEVICNMPPLKELISELIGFDI